MGYMFPRKIVFPLILEKYSMEQILYLFRHQTIFRACAESLSNRIGILHIVAVSQSSRIR